MLELILENISAYWRRFFSSPFSCSAIPPDADRRQLYYHRRSAQNAQVGDCNFLLFCATYPPLRGPERSPLSASSAFVMFTVIMFGLMGLDQ
jgi:hypothetical protein